MFVFIPLPSFFSLFGMVYTRQPWKSCGLYSMRRCLEKLSPLLHTVIAWTTTIHDSIQDKYTTNAKKNRLWSIGSHCLALQCNMSIYWAQPRLQEQWNNITDYVTLWTYVPFITHTKLYNVNRYLQKGQLQCVLNYGPFIDDEALSLPWNAFHVICTFFFF